MNEQSVLRVSNVTKTYSFRTPLLERLATKGTKSTALTALDGINLELRKGEILALVGESGSGKSTLAKILVGSIAASSGEITHNGSAMPAHRTKDLTRSIQMVFQDPYSSLNPRISVGSMLAELLLLHKIVPRREVRQESIRLLNRVGMDEDALDAYPSQFSGGQRQRIAIARALAVRPDVLIADEPVSALDVSVQATILDLFASLRDELGLTILFVAHNLAVVQHLSQRVAVMYLGRIVEVAETAELFANPRHPYTRALIASIPRMTAGSVSTELILSGEPPSPFEIPNGCRFHPRCPFATIACTENDPALLPLARRGGDADLPYHASACLLADALPQSTSSPARTGASAHPSQSHGNSQEAL
ncbi:ABC transporter ATP-binding protein [Glaciibacter superstes]|uniref:ABC transporter ATP-binding protein n=1 Tax=Glaciibacter superstes TaxID=501023 RepID=UPI0003B64328|nr:ABC transporter ATP-binding protein [Glaciibacter superstes]